MPVQINRQIWTDELKHKKALFKELSKQRDKAFPSMLPAIKKRLIELDDDIRILNQKIKAGK